MTQRVAAESSFALAKGNVKGNGILWTPSQLTIPASQWSCDDLGTGCDTTRRKNNNATALIYRFPKARHPCPTSQHFVTSGKLSTTHIPSPLNYREIPSPFDTPTVPVAAVGAVGVVGAVGEVGAVGAVGTLGAVGVVGALEREVGRWRGQFFVWSWERMEKFFLPKIFSWETPF